MKFNMYKNHVHFKLCIVFFIQEKWTPSYHIHLWYLSLTKSLTVFGCDCGTLFCGCASLVWAKTQPWSIRNGNDRCENVRIWPFLCHFTGEGDNTRKEDEGTNKKDRGRRLGWGRNHQQQRQSWLILAAGVQGLTQHTLNCIPFQI